MAIENIPVWPYEANWNSKVTETLEWLTSILASPTGAEQRRSLRRFPRRELEFSVVVPFEERSGAEDFIVRHGGRNVYLPLWQEAYRLDNNAIAGSGALLVKSAGNGGIVAGDIVFIGSPINALDFELVEVQSVAANTLSLVSPIARDWQRNARIHPVRRSRLTDQPLMRVVGDSLASTTLSFVVMEQNTDADPDADFDELFGSYDGFPVMTIEPDFTQAGQRGFERLIESYDNKLSFPVFRDMANQAFPTQAFYWVNRGRAEYERLRKLFYMLNGRFRAVWLPSYTADLRMVANTPAGAQYLQVGNIGYTARGGVANGRTRVCITKTDGTRIYRRITNSTVTSAGDEVFALDATFNSALTKQSVLRISFMQLCRLDQDRVEIVHETDTQGVSMCSATFKAAPNLREVRAGF